VPAAADQAAMQLLVEGKSYWEYAGKAGRAQGVMTWYLGGTQPGWQGTPLAVAVALEEDNVYLARQIGRRLLEQSLSP